MPAIRINLQGANSFEPLPPAFYIVRVSAYEMKTSKSGAPYIAWTLTVEAPPTASGPEADASRNHDGRKVWLNTSLQPQALWKLAEFLRACGLNPPDEGDFEFDPDACLDKYIIASIGQREYNGKIYNDVEETRPVSGDFVSVF